MAERQSEAARAAIERNLAAVRERIGLAAERVGRAPDSIRLVAVTKTVTAELAQLVLQAGCRDLGENRPQELWRKAELVTGPVRWHLVGHLQRNKVRRTLPLVAMIHSADSRRLLERIEQVAAEESRSVDLLLEVNVSGEASKHGFALAEVPAIVESLGRYEHIRVRGLMTMAPYDPDPEQARPTFAALRELRDRLEPNAPPNCSLAELSMGMSGDFEVAIEEGATIVRIGSALFEGLGE
jgi:hypothetical protein